ncbi:MAG: hypothetical protein MUE36_13280 [Acidimicrobiales bacterium]|nr:hypothetical protein [Acidimicrobiales bacterium]
MVVGALLGVVAGVVAVGGAAKLRDPDASAPMLRALGLPSSRLLARALGAVEVVVGVSAYLLGGPVPAAVTAALYLGFTVAILRLRAGGQTVSCGCFGRSSAPPSLLHVAVDGAAAVVATVAAITAAPGFLEMRPDLPGAGVAYLLVSGVAVGLVVALLTALPDALAAARRLPASEAAALRPVQSFRLGGSIR